MKTLLIALATLTAGVGSIHASLFSPSVVPGAIIGGAAGAVIGNNSGAHRGVDGAVIGAVAGGLIGAAIDNDRSATRYPVPASVSESCPPTVVNWDPAPRVVYIPEPSPRREVYFVPRREIVIVQHDRDHRRGHDRDDRGYYRH